MPDTRVRLHRLRFTHSRPTTGRDDVSRARGPRAATRDLRASDAGPHKSAQTSTKMYMHTVTSHICSVATVVSSRPARPSLCLSHTYRHSLYRYQFSEIACASHARLSSSLSALSRSVHCRVRAARALSHGAWNMVEVNYGILVHAVCVCVYGELWYMQHGHDMAPRGCECVTRDALCPVCASQSPACVGMRSPIVGNGRSHLPCAALLRS